MATDVWANHCLSGNHGSTNMHTCGNVCTGGNHGNVCTGGNHGNVCTCVNHGNVCTGGNHGNVCAGGNHGNVCLGLYQPAVYRQKADGDFEVVEQTDAEKVGVFIILFLTTLPLLLSHDHPLTPPPLCRCPGSPWTPWPRTWFGTGPTARPDRCCAGCRRGRCSTSPPCGSTTSGRATAASQVPLQPDYCSTDRTAAVLTVLH